MASESDNVVVVSHTADVSICSMICRVALEEHKVPNLTHKNVDIECCMENYEAEFVRIQPKMTVPCMQYGEEIIGDSKDIMYFLSEKHADAGLYPADQKDAIDAFLNLFYSKFGFIAQFTFGNWVNKSEDIKKFIQLGKATTSIEKLEKLIAEHPDLKEVAQKKLEGKKRFDFIGFMSSVNLQAMDVSMKGVLDTMEAALEKSAYMCGDTYTLADITATAFLARIHIVKDEAMFGPNTTKYWNEKLKTRPSFQAAYVLWKWEQTLMYKQIEVFVAGGDPKTIKWTTPPSVL